MRIPCHLYWTIQRVRKQRPRLLEKLGREPNLDELVQVCQPRVTQAQIEWALKVLDRTAISLDACFNDDSENTLQDTLADETNTPSKQLSCKEEQIAFQTAFKDLDSEEREVLTLRFGLGDQEKQTQEQTCKRLGIKKSRLISIQRRAQAKLRESSELQEIAEVMDIE
jgi:RNA polymerase sigma factor (sigma-70 family)